MQTILTDISVRGHQLHLSLKDLGSFIARDYQHTFPLKRSPAELVDWAWHELRWREALLNCPRSERNVLFDLVQAEGPINLAQSRCFTLGQIKEHLLRHPLTEEWPETISWLIDYTLEKPPRARKPYSLEALEKHWQSYPRAYHYEFEINRLINVLKEGWPIHGKDDKTPKVVIPSPLPEEFFRGNYASLARWQIAPKGSVVEVEDSLVEELKQGEKEIALRNRIKYLRARTFEELMAEPMVILDIEMPLFKREEAEVSWTALLHYRQGKRSGQTVFSLYEVEEPVNNFQTKKSQSGNELVDKVKLAIVEKEPKPTIFVAYNAHFDSMELREAGDFEIGEDETEPKKIATLKFFERIGIKSMDVLDPWKWARTQFSYLPNQKLLMVRRHLFGEEEEKEIDYGQMEELELICQGRLKPGEASQSVQNLVKEKPAAGIIASYVSKDVLPLADILDTKIFRRSLEDVTYLAQLFRIDPFLLQHDAKRVQDFLERKFFEKTGTFRGAVHPHLKVFMNYEQKVENKFKREIRKRFLPTTGRLKGSISHVAKAYLPLGRILQPDLEYFFPETRQFYNYADSHSADHQRRFFLARYEDALAGWMWKDYAAYLYEKEKLENVCSQKGIERSSFSDFCWRTAQGLRKKGLEEKLNKCIIAQRELLEEVPGKFLEEKNLDLKEFHQLFRQWSLARQKNRILWGAYETGWQTFEYRLEKFCQKIKDYFAREGIEVVHAQNWYLYLRGRTDKLPSLYREDCPVIPVDEIEQAFLTSEKIFYQKHGFFEGWKQEKEPQYNHPLFEIEMTGEFLNYVLANQPEEALTVVWQELDALSSRNLPKNELVRQTKATGMYRAYENGEEIAFYDWEKEQTTLKKTVKRKEYEMKRQNDGRRDYILEPVYDGKEKEITFHQRFIMKIDELEPDWEMAGEKAGEKMKELIQPLLGRELAGKFVRDALSTRPRHQLEFYLSKLDRPSKQMELFQTTNK